MLASDTCASSRVTGPTPAEIARAFVPRLESNLTRNILPFWLEKSLDRTFGGYTINFGPRGEAKGPAIQLLKEIA